KAGYRAIDQARAVGGERLVVEAEFRQPADLEIFDQHVGARGELFHEPLAVDAFDEWRPPGAGIVTGALALDLDHVGAEVCEQLAGPRPSQDARKLEYAQTR